VAKGGRIDGGDEGNVWRWHKHAQRGGGGRERQREEGREGEKVREYEGVKREGYDLFVRDAQITGHASTRMGWALVDDPEVADQLQQLVCPLDCPLESQAGTLSLLSHLSPPFSPSLSPFSPPSLPLTFSLVGKPDWDACV
jgi:hypothetical protein